MSDLPEADSAPMRLLRMLLDVVEMDPFTFKVQAIGVRPPRWDVAHGGVEHRAEPGACSLCSAIAEVRAFLALDEASAKGVSGEGTSPAADSMAASSPEASAKGEAP